MAYSVLETASTAQIVVDMLAKAVEYFRYIYLPAASAAARIQAPMFS